MRLKAVISYDGSKFNGFQRLNDGSGVQNKVEDALRDIYGYEILIKGSGRTDAKVHANFQVISFDVENNKKILIKELNNKLNPNILVKTIKKVNDDFDPRRMVKKKEYVYKINMGLFKVCYNDYYLQIPYKLDIPFMKEASKIFIGTHDFRNFVAGKRDNYVTTIYSIDFVKFGNKLEIRFVGTGFYRYMIRKLVGALIEVGKCKIDINIIKKMVYDVDIKHELPTAEAQGLYLNKIWY